MERMLYGDLLAWKKSRNRKPLILEGARQTGKTWILKSFAEREYENLVYVNCDNNKDAENLFHDYDMTRVLRDLSAMSSQPVIPGKTLIFLDEIQEISRGIPSLKYFCEDAADYHVVVAGSLLGISLHEGTGYPVGKVNTLRLYPMSFSEFLLAMGHRQIVELAENANWTDFSVLKTKMTDLLKQYYYVGGMPEVVCRYSENNDLAEVRSVQDEILMLYRRDFSRHIPPAQIPRVNMVWDAIPSQLAKENKKFIYGAMKKGARAKEFEVAIQWLTDAGLIHKVDRISNLEKPLKFYRDNAAFKLFFFDVGLLGAMSGVSAKEVLTNNRVFVEYKGAFAENYVAQQYYASVHKELFYYVNERASVEIDFVTQGDAVHPIEVKAEENLKSKSLSSVLQKKPHAFGWRFSMSDYREQERMKNIPLYLADAWFRKHL